MRPRNLLTRKIRSRQSKTPCPAARDIIAEWINENAEVRAKIRELFFNKGSFKSKVMRGREQEGRNYQDYFDWQEEINTVPSHRILAVRRGEKEKALLLRVVVPERDALDILEDQFVTGNNACSQQVRLAAYDCFKRLLSLSMETEVRVASKQRADKEAINVFSQNLRQLLMAPPLGQRNVMAIDPGFRTGCKVACLDRQGNMRKFETIYPTAGSAAQSETGKALIKGLCEQFSIEFIAIGNGTASRETEGIYPFDRPAQGHSCNAGLRKRRFYLFSLGSGP